jgi:hypothetical protein
VDYGAAERGDVCDVTTLAQITADDDAYHATCRQRLADVPTARDLAQRDADTAREIVARLQVFVMQLLVDYDLFWFDRDCDIYRRESGRLLPRDVAHMTSAKIAAYLPTVKKSRRCEHALVIVREMLPILADAETRLSEALAKT